MNHGYFIMSNASCHNILDTVLFMCKICAPVDGEYRDHYGHHGSLSVSIYRVFCYINRLNAKMSGWQPSGKIYAELIMVCWFSLFERLVGVIVRTKKWWWSDIKRKGNEDIDGGISTLWSISLFFFFPFMTTIQWRKQNTERNKRN